MTASALHRSNVAVASARSTWRRVSAALLLAWASLDISAAATPQDLAALDPLVEQQRYDEALQQLRKTGASQAAKIEWLRRQAEAGHVPLQYELSALLYPTNREESFKWYARGRLARTLDGAECARPDASYGARVVLDGVAASVRDAAVADAKAFNRAIDEAFEWDEKRTAWPSAMWICGESVPGIASGLRRGPERLAARDEARRDMRIAAKTISDFQRAVERGEKARIKVVDSGIFVMPPDIRRWAAWLDNDRLLFVGFPLSTTNIPRPPPSKPRGYGAVILLWDTKQDRIDVALRPSYVNELCVDGERVVIVAFNEDDSGVVYEGRYPNLESHPFGLALEVLRNVRIDCEPPHSTAGPRKSYEDIWLRKGDGFIERPMEPVSPDGSRPFARYHRQDGNVVDLPVRANGAWVLAYAPWRSAYLLQGESRHLDVAPVTSAGGRRPGDDAVLFWLYPDGKTVPIIVPYGQWDMTNNVSTFYRPTARGLVLAGGHSDNDYEPGFSGLFLFEDTDTVTRLVAGPSKVAAISPDGCRVAFGHAPNIASLRLNDRLQFDRENSQTMKMIDVCRS